MRHGIPKSQGKDVPPQSMEQTMSHAGYSTRPSSNFVGDRLQWQLQNVFRILAKPEHKLWDKAIKLRQDVSATWGTQAAQGNWFPWPTTIASPGARRLKEVDWRPNGMLSFLGYHVGETQPTPQDIRWCILEYAFECHLPPLNDPLYYLEWGMPLTAQRLKKLANTLAALTRNANRRDGVSFARAIDHWEHDLVLLRERYYLDFFHFCWPATDRLH
jgi:hypothetical protein